VQSLTLLVVAVCGCSPASTGTLSGKVRHQGTPVTAGLVTFHGPDNQTVFATIQPDGTYTATDVPRGLVRVTVRERPRAAAGMEKRLQERNRGSFKPPDAGAVQLPKKYSDLETTDLSLTVTGGSQSFDIDMN
jgi:hypothetical protein